MVVCKRVVLTDACALTCRFLCLSPPHPPSSPPSFILHRKTHPPSPTSARPQTPLPGTPIGTRTPLQERPQVKPRLIQESPWQTKPKKGRCTNFSRGQTGTKVRCESRLFPEDKHENSQNWAKFMNFLFWPFLWFGLLG